MSYLVLKYVGIPQKQTLMPEEERLSSRTGELARESEVEQAKKQKLFLPPGSFYGGFHQKLWPRIRVCLPPQMVQSRISPHGHALLPGF